MCFNFSCASLFQIEKLDSYQSSSLKDIDPKKTVNKDVGLVQLTEAQYYKEIAYAYAQEGNCDKAHELYLIHNSYQNDLKNENSDKSIDLDSDSLYQLAYCNYKAKKYALSLIFAERIPDDKTREDIAKLTLLSDIYTKANSFVRAREINNKIYQHSKDLSYIWRNYELSYSNKNWSDAILDLNFLATSQEDPYQINVAKYLVYKEQNNDELSLKHLLEAEQIKPLESKLLLSAAHLQRKLMNWNDLYKTSSRYLSKFSFNYEMVENYLTACSHLLKYDEIEYYVSKVSKEQPRIDYTKSDFYIDYQIYKSELDWKNKNFNAAINRLESAYVNRPDHLSNVFKLSKYLIWNNQDAKAEKILTQSSYRHPDNAEIKLLMAYISFRNNKEDNFISELGRLENFEKNNSEIYSIMAEYWHKKQKPKNQTISLINKAIDLNSENPKIRPILGDIMVEENNLSQAMLIFEKLYNDNPTDPKYIDALSNIYSKLNLIQKREDLEIKSSRRPASINQN